MVKVTPVPERNMVVAELSGTSMIAFDYICKRIHPSLCSLALMDACAMPDKFRVEAKPLGTDVYNEGEGRKVARAKVLRNFHKSRTKAIARGKVFLVNAAKSIDII